MSCMVIPAPRVSHLGLLSFRTKESRGSPLLSIRGGSPGFWVLGRVVDFYVFTIPVASHPPAHGFASPGISLAIWVGRDRSVGFWVGLAAACGVSPFRCLELLNFSVESFDKNFSNRHDPAEIGVLIGDTYGALACHTCTFTTSVYSRRLGELW
jgi:hypothetical protein